MATLHDVVCIQRYGPTDIKELFCRELSADGHVTLLPTDYMQKVRQYRLQLHGRRFGINGKERSDRGTTRVAASDLGPVDADGPASAVSVQGKDCTCTA